MRSRFCAPLLAVTAVAIILLLGGCFETTLNLGSAEDAKVDVQYCGDWRFTSKDDQGQTTTAELVVRNFDGKQYYAEWKEDGSTSRLSAFFVPVKTATFAQVSALGDKGQLAEKHCIMRVQLDGTKLTLRQLDPEFFQGITTDAALRAKVEENLDNAAMYKGSITGSLVSQP